MILFPRTLAQAAQKHSSAFVLLFSHILLDLDSLLKLKPLDCHSLAIFLARLSDFCE